MRDQLKVQELMDSHLDSRDEELCQLCAQLQEDGAKLAALSLQLQDVISSVEERFRVVERDLEEVMVTLTATGGRSIGSRRGRRKPEVSSLGQLTRQSFSRPAELLTLSIGSEQA